MEGKLSLGLNPINGKPFRAVIVDDSAMMRKLLGQILRSESFEIASEFETGESAVEAARRGEFRADLAFVDIEMPGIDGIETVTRLKKIAPGMKYVMCTGITDKEVVRELLRLSISGYIVKPFDREKVMERLEPILGGRQL